MNREEIENHYQPRIDNIEIIISNMRNQGLNPEEFYDAQNNDVLNLVSVLSYLKSEKTKYLTILEVEEFVRNMPLGNGAI